MTVELMRLMGREACMEEILQLEDKTEPSSKGGRTTSASERKVLQKSACRKESQTRTSDPLRVRPTILCNGGKRKMVEHATVAGEERSKLTESKTIQKKKLSPQFVAGPPVAGCHQQV